MQTKNKISIKEIKSVTNPTSVHGIYPYRGKISAIDATAVVKQLNPGVLLDPFCGSGTIVYEASRAGLHAIGVDNNPLAIWIAKGKLSSLIGDKNSYLKEADILIRNAKKNKVKTKLSPLIKKAFHEKTAKEVYALAKEFNKMSEYNRACFLGTIALAARGCNQYKWTSSTVGKDVYPKQYINFYEKFLNKIKKHVHTENHTGTSEIYLHDSRDLLKIIKNNSVDYVFTSPPYFDALDYTAYYGRIVYDLLGKNHLNIKKNLIQRISEYESDMKKVFAEIVRVTKKDGLIIFVVGDKKVKDRIINGGAFFSGLLRHQPNTVIERNYTGSSSQIFDKLNKTNRKEQIVIWDKSTWK